MNSFRYLLSKREIVGICGDMSFVRIVSSGKFESEISLDEVSVILMNKKAE